MMNDAHQESGDDGSSPDRKRAKTQERVLKEKSEGANIPEAPQQPCHEAFRYLQQLLLTPAEYSRLPESLATTPPIRQDSQRLQTLLKEHGFRAALVTSPRPGVSIYIKDTSNNDVSLSEGREFLWTMLGLLEHQEILEEQYQTTYQSLWCLSLFCQKIRKAYFPQNDGDARFKALETELLAIEQYCQQTVITTAPQLSLSTESMEARVATLIALAVPVKNISKRLHRAEEWEREYQRICAANCTLANAYLAIFLLHHQILIHDVVYKPAAEVKFERISVFLYDPDGGDTARPPTFLFLPRLHTIFHQGIEKVVAQMVDSAWSNMIRLGYFPSEAVKTGIAPNLTQFFVHGFLSQKQNGDLQRLPLSLRARFEPTCPLSLYLHGCAGSGKSSFARFFPIALQDTLMQFADPEYVVRVVKQNLNKKMKHLEAELELRPNNNDMSLMSIIQSRKQKMSQAKRGLVILNMEEMPRYEPDGNPDQMSVVKLVCQRFGGRKSDYRQQDDVSRNGTEAPRNSGRHSIGNDCSLVTIFTSNYELHEMAKHQLKQLETFQNIAEISVVPLSGEDRSLFARKFFASVFDEQDRRRNRDLCSESILDLQLELGEGDVRPLVKTLRIIAFYFVDWIKVQLPNCTSNVTKVLVKQSERKCAISLFAGAKHVVTLELLRHTYACGFCWFPVRSSNEYPKLDEILNLWKAKALAPAVLLSRNKHKSEELMNSLAVKNHYHCIRDVRVDQCKMTKSLYDPKDTPNLRDDISKFGRGALVAVELCCPTEQSQLLVREMIEDSPSMTAFSSARSALYKEGILFVLNVDGDLTPEVASRVSYEI